MAGRFGYEIPEVSLLFYNTLYRGCRTSKVNASGFQAFNSPNFKPLATIGVDFNGTRVIFKIWLASQFLHMQFRSNGSIY